MQIARLALFGVNEKKELPEKEPALSWDQAVVKVINLPLDQSAVIDGAWTGRDSSMACRSHLRTAMHGARRR
jgi:hypothetical protein